MPQIIYTVTMGWLSHTAWSEKYVGLRKLAFESLPLKIYEMSPEDSAICQSVIVGSSQLVEIALFDILERYVGKYISKKDSEVQFYKALCSLPVKITGKEIDLTGEPYLSSEKLRKRRNSTVHKTSSLADVVMSRSALYTAVETSLMLYQHFDIEFPHARFLDKYPIAEQPLFSQVTYPESYHHKNHTNDIG